MVLCALLGISAHDRRTEFIYYIIFVLFILYRKVRQSLRVEKSIIVRLPNVYFFFVIGSQMLQQRLRSKGGDYY